MMKEKKHNINFDGERVDDGVSEENRHSFFFLLFCFHEAATSIWAHVWCKTQSAFFTVHCIHIHKK